MSDAPSGNRIAQRKLEFRDKITSAALQLFQEQGVHDTSVASIIKAADIAHKTFFNHFPTKDHLLLHIARNYSELAYRALQADMDKIPDPRKRMEFLLLHIANTLEDVHPHYRELMKTYLIVGSGDRRLHLDSKLQFSTVISHIVKEAASKKLLRPGHTVETYSEVVVGLCVATLLNWSIEDDFQLTQSMKRAAKFIRTTIFIT